MKKFLFLALCLGLCGCATLSNFKSVDASNMNNIKVGMSKEEVIKELGKPFTTGAENGIECLEYRFREAEAGYRYGVMKPYVVCIKDGKAISFGRFQNDKTNIIFENISGQQIQKLKSQPQTNDELQAIRLMTGQKFEPTGNDAYDQQLEIIETLKNQNKKDYPKKYRIGDDGYMYAE